jgi:hypothetical protein
MDLAAKGMAQLLLEFPIPVSREIASRVERQEATVTQ